MTNFFKNPWVIAALVVIGLVLLALGLSAILKSNNEQVLQTALDDINTRIEQASASRGTNLPSLISERETIIEIIKYTVS